MGGSYSGEIYIKLIYIVGGLVLDAVNSGEIIKASNNKSPILFQNALYEDNLFGHINECYINN